VRLPVKRLAPLRQPLAETASPAVAETVKNPHQSPFQTGRIPTSFSPRSLGQSHPELVVHRHLELLLSPEVALGRLDGGVPQQKLDLLEGTAGEPA
jgi:hypothetical protein